MKRGKHAHHVRHDEEKRWKTTPLGVRILIIYTGILALFYLIFGVTIPTNIFFGVIAFGNWARALNLIFLVVLVAIVVGFLMKKHWAGKLAFVFFSFEILNLLSSFVLKYRILTQAFLVFVSVAIILLNFLILWYLYEKKSYFSDIRHFKTGKADKIFVTGIIFFVLIVLLSTASYATKMYKTTIELTNKMIEDLRGRTQAEALFRCSFYDNDEKDVCYLVAASAYKNVPRETCNEIENSFYRLTCMQAVIL